MGSFPVVAAPRRALPSRLFEIPQPPTALTSRGQLPPPDLPLLTIVGARKYSTYGRQVVDTLVAGLAGYRVGIVSGLALGIDSLAHEAALRHQLYTLAIPGSGLADEVLYPRSHVRLAQRILESGGGLLSEFASDFRATKWSFIQRNRIMAGIAHATLVIEATERSGTLTTARMCTDYNRELGVVPGSIFSTNSAGPHLFMKLGATPVTSASDLIELLNLTPIETISLVAPTEADPVSTAILTALTEPLTAHQLQQKTGLDAVMLNQSLMLMELGGQLTAHNGLYQRTV